MNAQLNPLSKEMYTVLERQDVFVDRVMDQVPTMNPLLYGTDSYKVSHIKFETIGVTEIYSNFTPRFAKYMTELLGVQYDEKYVVFGVQWLLLRLHTMMKKGFFDRKKDDVMAEMRRVMIPYIANDEFAHFEKLHDLGYLPIVVKTLDEGSVVPVGIPFLTIRNTLPEFEWLPNYLETLFSTDSWKQLTVATITRAFRLISNRYAIETTGGTEGTEWQNHDFSCRGQSGLESSAINGVGFLLSSCGTDNLAALWACDKFYDSPIGGDQLLAGSVSAGEHSVTTLGILTEQECALAKGESIDLGESEYRYAKTLLTDRFPTGIFSYVSDSFDFYNFIGSVIPRLKTEILARDGKFVVRGDSGNPIDVICGIDESNYLVLDGYKNENEDDLKELLYEVAHDLLSEETTHGEQGDDEYTMNIIYDGELKEVTISGFQWNRHDKQYYYLDTYYSDVNVEIKDVERTVEHKGTIEVLWDIFGGTVNELGYKVLDSHIGMIYGDGITVQRSEEILKRLKHKGFASTNIVFGVGSYSLNMISRDHLGMAIKATNAIVEVEGVDVDKAIYKEPKTDMSKKSARGLLSVHKHNDTGEYKLIDMCTRTNEELGELSVAYMNGQFHKLTNVFEIRERLWG